jgi:hypothetical protein
MSKANKVSIGAFNLYIGFAMLGVILAHTIGLFHDYSISIIVRAIFEIITYIGIFGFAIISGYKLKLPGNLKKYISKVCRDYLELYYIFGFITVITFGVIHFWCFRYLKATLKEMLLMAIGYLFAIYPAISIGNYTIYSCEPLYFFVALIMAEVITVFILTSFEKYREIIVGITVLIGSILMYLLPGTPFALSHGMLLTGCIYVGYVLREKAFYENGIDLKTSIIIIGISVCVYLLKYIPHTGCFEYFFNTIAGSLAGIVLIKYCIMYSSAKNRIFPKIKEIGKLSFFVLGAHAIEYYAVPWYLLVDRMNGIPAELGMLIIYIIRLLIIFIIVRISEYLYKKSLLKK